MTAELQATRGRLGELGARLRERPALIYRVSLPVLAVAVVALLVHLHGYFLDLEVYRLGVRAWLSGGDLYGALPQTSVGNVLPFIYPPFAALLMVPLTVVGWTTAWVSLFIVSLASLAVTLYVVLRRLWPTGGSAGALAATSALLPASLVFEPVLETFRFGQVNLILMAMVAVDCLAARTRWPRGMLIGLAAAIKLTPAAFVLFFLLRKDYRAGATTVVAAAVATGIGALVAPASSLRYWGGGMSAVSGVSGSPFFTNQTFQAVLARAGVAGLELKVVWLVLSAAVLLLALPVLRKAPRPLALVALAGVALLASPTSWSHHWVWVAPAILIAGVSAWRAGSRQWAAVTGVLTVIFVVAPHQFLPHGGVAGVEVTWSTVQQVVGASYVLVTVVVFVLLGITWRKRPAVD
ncbi:alpha-(1-2)-phosphatidylinositol mannoside mannosyltransferase [Pseudonocardia eucalypti]|uniref:Alpha-(1-2)-phosphatidylinositol mannoside mannosyltransferase n=1 Tax=Pseudonocardia eucalypti TaxID=648755 RepID=A0ABP9PY55_9PSEU|nr:alpha-1,2-mannosyltransferase [Pseudonocardia eucalypti]